MPRLHPLYALAGAAILFLLYSSLDHISSGNGLALRSKAHGPANSTLGFGAIYVVSGPGSPRREPLIEAANVTELDLTFPELPDWTEDQVMRFKPPKTEGRDGMANGSSKAWQSHLYALRGFVDSEFETALFTEDDIDFDIRIRTLQAPRAAAAFRSMRPTASSEYYWASPEDWDLIYLGHCGDYWGDVMSHRVGVGYVYPEDLTARPHVIYDDDTMLAPWHQHQFTQSLLAALGVRPKARVIHKSVSPLCTFGYAVTKKTAELLLAHYSAPFKDPESPRAFDVAILQACDGTDLRCFTVNPELLHHMEGESLIDGEAKSLAFRPPVDRLGYEQVRHRKETVNINCGFWSKDFYWDGDKAKLDRLRKDVGRQGKCLKPGRAEDGSYLIQS